MLRGAASSFTTKIPPYFVYSISSVGSPHFSVFDERSILSLVGSTGKHSPPSLRRISIPSLRPPLIPTHVSNSNELVLPILYLC